MAVKKFIYLLSLTVVASCNNKPAEQYFSAEGTIKNATEKVVYFEEVVPGGSPVIMDSAQLKPDGSFSVTAPSKEESLYQLRMSGVMVPFARFISDVPKIKITADMKNVMQPYTIEGSVASQSLIDFDKSTYEQGQQAFAAQNILDSLQKAAASDSLINLQYSKVETGVTAMKTYAQDFLTKGNSPVLTLYGISSFQNTTANLGMKGFTPVEMSSIINAAAIKFPKHTALQKVKQTFSQPAATATDSSAAKAPDFTQPDVNGQPVSLSSFKGKYVLIDFWASWCAPCRQENPNVVRAYKQFKDKNFTVLGVSLDQNKDAWLKAIQQDGLTWTHVSDLKYWDNEAAALYGVREIPSNVLIDPQGNVVGRNLHGQEIMERLKEVIKD